MMDIRFLDTGETNMAPHGEVGKQWYLLLSQSYGTDTLSTGVDNTISLSSLGWSGANFYYKVTFTSYGGTVTPVLDDITVNYTITQ